MNLENFINSLLNRPTDTIAYAVSRKLAELYPDRAVVEGEEEVGSENLERYIAANVERLRADAVVSSDSSMFAPGIPSILSSLRGLAYFQIDVDDVQRKITRRTKAIIAVHLYGQIGQMPALKDVADRHNIFLIEDAAHKPMFFPCRPVIPRQHRVRSYRHRLTWNRVHCAAVARPQRSAGFQVISGTKNQPSS